MHRGQVAPLVKHMDVGAPAARIKLADAYGPGKRPGLQLFAAQGQLQAQPVHGGTFAAGAYAFALTDLAGKASAFARLQAQGLRAQRLRVAQAAQSVVGLALGAVGAIQAAHIGGGDVVQANQREQGLGLMLVAQLPCAQTTRAAQQAVVDGLALLDPARFEQQGA